MVDLIAVTAQSMEKKLFDNLMNNYPMSVRPVKNSTGQITIEISFLMQAIDELVSNIFSVIGGEKLKLSSEIP